MQTVEVITLVKNNKEGLEKTFASLRSQSYQDWLMTIVVAESGDSSLELANQIKSQNLKVRVFTEPGFGIYAAMNLALRSRRHDYVWFMNSGDIFYSSNSMLTAIKEMERREAHIVMGGYGYETSAGERSFVRKAGSISPLRFSLNIRSGCHQSMLFNLNGSHQMEFDTRYSIAADFEFVLKMIKNGSAYRVNIPLAKIEPGGVSDRRFKEGLKEKDRIRYNLFGRWSLGYLAGKLQNSLIICKSALRDHSKND